MAARGRKRRGARKTRKQRDAPAPGSPEATRAWAEASKDTTAICKTCGHSVRKGPGYCSAPHVDYFLDEAE